MTVPAAIKELEKIEMTRQTDNVYRLDHAVTAKQKKILKAFGMNEGNITYRAGDIIILLYHEDMIYFGVTLRSV